MQMTLNSGAVWLIDNRIDKSITSAKTQSVLKEGMLY